MNPSKDTNTTCPENEQIQVPSRPKRKLLFNPLFINLASGVVGVNQERASERRKARDSQVPPDQSLQETSHDNSQTSASSKSTNARNIDGNSEKPIIKTYKQAGNASKNIENDNNYHDSQAASTKTVKQADDFSRNDKKTNNYLLDRPKSSIKSNASSYNDRQNIERAHNNYQFHQKTNTKFAYQTDNASQSFENIHVTKCNTFSIKSPNHEDSELGHPQISSGNSNKDNSNAISENGDDGWGTVSESGDYPEDGWGSEREDDSHTQDNCNNRSKTSGSECSQRVQHVERSNRVPSNVTQQNSKSTKLDLSVNRCDNNLSRLQKDRKDLNHSNTNRNMCSPSNVELKPFSRQGCITKTESQESENKESYRPKLDLYGNKAHSYQDNNSPTLNQGNFNNRNLSSNIEKIYKQESCVKNKSQEPESEVSGWPELDRYDPPSNVELKTIDRQDYSTKTTSQESENKEFYRPKSDLNGINTRSYHDKNRSSLNQSNSNNRNLRWNAYTPPSSKIETNDKQDSCFENKNKELECEASGWPKLDPDDKKPSRDGNFTWENLEEVGSNDPKPYQRSNSTPFTHSSSRSHLRRDGRGDEPDSEFQPESSRMQQGFSKVNLSPSTSFTEQKSNKQTAGAHNTNQSYKTESYGRVASNEITNLNTKASDWHETRNVIKHTNCRGSVIQKLKSLGSNKLITPSSLNNNQSNVKRESFLKCVNRSITDDDKWNSTPETSQVHNVVLEENSETFERKRLVIGNSIENLKITVSCCDHPKEEPDQLVTEDNRCSPKNISEIDDLPQPFLDPLQDDFDFFDDNPDPYIPAPLPPSAYVELHNTAASNALSTAVMQAPESLKFSSSEAILKAVADARHIQEITSYLTELETEKSVPLETSEKILKNVVKSLDQTSQSSWGKDFVYIYGSYVSGLAVSTSNINFALKTHEEIKSKQANSYLLHLQRGFLNVLKGYQVEPFDEDNNPKKSKVCFTEMNTGIPCELGFHSSTVSKYLIMNKMLRNVCEFDQRIKTLLIATRIWAEVCLIHESEEGKLHPVGYSLLMLHFLQNLDKPLLPVLITDPSVEHWGLNQLERKNDSSVGELWLAFLKYYSEFNWGDNVVTVNSKTTVSKSSKNWEQSFLAIEDPFTQNNIGDSVVSEHCAECIFACFKASYDYFSTPVDYEDSESSFSDSGINESPNSFKKEVFSFNYISFDQNIPSVCEKCEELNETCNKCRPRKEVITQSLPKLSEASLDCVNRTLHDVYNEFMLQESQTKERIAFVKILEIDVRKAFPGATLKLFGSSVNGFGFKKSDIDICMTFNHKPESNSEISRILNQIVRFLRKRPNLYENVYGLYHAKIPIVKFHVIQQGWHCDLSLYNILAVHNSKLLWKYSLYDERCRILGCAMKLLAKKACLDDTRHLSSYSYILTVIHYLQQVEPPVLPVLHIDHKEVFDEKLVIPSEAMDHCNYWLTDKIEQLRRRYSLHPKNTSTVGELWLGLLDFFARYDGTNAITITQKELLPSTDLRRCARLLNIQDPFLETDNLGCILNEIGADETRKVLTRARLLFGKEIPKEHKNFPKRYFFSSSYLTGRSVKEIECTSCGGFGHLKSDCLKADPFKRSKFKIRVPKAKYPRKP